MKDIGDEEIDLGYRFYSVLDSFGKSYMGLRITSPYFNEYLTTSELILSNYSANTLVSLVTVKYARK
jgi:hypothetical protein